MRTSAWRMPANDDVRVHSRALQNVVERLLREEAEAGARQDLRRLEQPLPEAPRLIELEADEKPVKVRAWMLAEVLAQLMWLHDRRVDAIEQDLQHNEIVRRSKKGELRSVEPTFLCGRKRLAQLFPAGVGEGLAERMLRLFWHRKVLLRNLVLNGRATKEYEYRFDVALLQRYIDEENPPVETAPIEEETISGTGDSGTADSSRTGRPSPDPASENPIVALLTADEWKINRKTALRVSLIPGITVEYVRRQVAYYRAQPQCTDPTYFAHHSGTKGGGLVRCIEQRWGRPKGDGATGRRGDAGTHPSPLSPGPSPPSPPPEDTLQATAARALEKQRMEALRDEEDAMRRLTEGQRDVVARAAIARFAAESAYLYNNTRLDGPAVAPALSRIRAELAAELLPVEEAERDAYAAAYLTRWPAPKPPKKEP